MRLTALLEARGLEKRFGGARALDGASLTVREGEVHALLGENGAGKSTLIGCLAGLHRPDAGRLDLGGAPHRPATPAQARAAGVAVIHQELSVVPGFTAADALAMGRPHPTRRGLLDLRAMRRAARDALAPIAPDLPVDVPMRALPAGRRQLVEIARALQDEARLLVLDEPTAALSGAEADRLHAVLRDLAARGRAVLYVTHRLGDALAHCSRATVLRAGRTVLEASTEGLTRDALVGAMSGPVEAGPARREARPGAEVLRLDRLPFGPDGVSLSVREGEVVGLYGLVGAGRSSLLRRIWGASPGPGAALLRGEPLRGGVRGRIRRGVAYVPEERRSEALWPGLSVLDNAALPRLDRLRAAPGVPSRRRALALLDAVRTRFDLRAGRPDAPAASLSGGNQQKLVVGRWTTEPLELLLLDEPTRGVDPGAKARLHAEIRALTAAGTAVLAATSDLEEALSLCDRVLVMAGGRLVGEPARQADAVLAAAFADA